MRQSALQRRIAQRTTNGPCEFPRPFVDFAGGSRLSWRKRFESVAKFTAFGDVNVA